jgi:hypothetical protein
MSSVIGEIKRYAPVDDSSQLSNFPIEKQTAQYMCWTQHVVNGATVWAYCSPEGDNSHAVGNYNDSYTITEWKLMDVNGDGLPDMVFSTPASQVIYSWSTEVRVMYNRGGDEPFDGESVRLHSTTCGVERLRHFDYTVGSDPVHGNLNYQYLSCGFTDVNGDGLVDFVDEDERRDHPHLPGAPTLMRAYLGTGLPDDFSAARSLRLPAPIGITRQPNTRRPGECLGFTTTYLQSSLIDMTGDGIPDYVYYGFRDTAEGQFRLYSVPDRTDSAFG